jgi:hypothetical protein
VRGIAGSVIGFKSACAQARIGGDNLRMDQRDFGEVFGLLALAIETRSLLRALPPSDELDHDFETMNVVFKECSDELRFRADLAEIVSERLRERCR